MSDIPQSVLSSVKDFAKNLTSLEQSLAKLTAITADDKAKMTNLERARIDLTIVNQINSLYCMYSATMGKDPSAEEAVGMEFRRCKEVMDRLTMLSERHLRPKINQKATKAVLRNALFDVGGYNQSRQTDATAEQLEGVSEEEIRQLVNAGADEAEEAQDIDDDDGEYDEIDNSTAGDNY